MQTSDRRAITRGTLIAGIVWLGLSSEIVVLNVALPSKTDNDGASVLISYLFIFAALFWVSRGQGGSHGCEHHARDAHFHHMNEGEAAGV